MQRLFGISGRTARSGVNIITNLKGTFSVLQLVEWFVHLHVQMISVNLHKIEHVYEKNSYGHEERALGSDLKNMNTFTLLVVSNMGLLLTAFHC